MDTTTREIFRKYTDEATFARIAEFGSVGGMWARCLADHPDAPAIVDEGRTRTYTELEADAASFRPLVAGTGRVGILAANSLEFVTAFLAAVTGGCTAVILPAQLDAPTVFGVCRKFGIGTLVYQPALAEKLAVVRERAPDVRLVPTDARADTPSAALEAAPESPCMIMFTGGTTGRSKGALLSHRAVMQGVVNGCYGYRDVFGQRYLLVLPLSHVFGLIRNLLTSLYTGSTLFICRNNKDMFRDIAAFRPTILVAVPALAELALMLSRKFGRNMLGTDMKYVICGAAAVSPYLVREYEALGIALFPGYGLTESANLVSGNPESARKPESVGIPYPHQQLRIEDGELWLRGMNMMDGYVGEDEAEAYTDGWFCTGDLARLDEEGFLYITGRVKEVIVLSNGENVSPAEVEARFNELPFVQDSQVFEDADEGGAHFLALEIVPRAAELPALGADPGAAMHAALERVNLALPSAMRVSRIVIRDSDFARTPSMKIVRYHKCK